VPESFSILEFEVPTWDRIYELLLNLAHRINQAKFKPDIIVGIARGGWPVARVLSDLLENPSLASVSAKYYVNVGETKHEPIIIQPVSAPVKHKRVLIVDDVADTGRSLALVRDHLNGQGAAEVKMATVYRKPWSIVTPDWFARETNLWILFPWDSKETLRGALEKSKKQGLSTNHVRESLVRSGFDVKLLERFLGEIAEE
jgi:hypoxanthine phosphoribosyltransferase